MIVRRGKIQDLLDMDIQESQKHILPYINDSTVELSNDKMLAYTIEHDNEILCVCGLKHEWENRATTWVILSQASGKHLTRVFRAVNRLLNKHNYRRMETTVDVDSKQEQRWVKLFGFEPEGYMKAYTPDGKDQVLYARIRWV